MKKLVLNLQTGERQIVDMTQAEIDAKNARVAKNEAEKPMRDWEKQMRKTDGEINARSIEDIFDVLSPEQKAALPKATSDKFTARKTLRGQKP